MAMVAVVASFRTGLLVQDVAQRVSSSADTGRHWSVLIMGTDSAEIVQQYIANTSLSPASRPYISAYNPSSITVSGPPGSISQLLKTTNLESRTTLSAPIYGPYHAAHLYSPEDIAVIASGLTSGAIGTRAEKIALLSTKRAPGSPAQFSASLEEAVAEVLLRPIYWEGILEVLQSKLSSMHPRGFSVVSIGSGAHQLIYNKLKKTDLHAIVSTDPGTLQVLAPPRSSKIHAAKPKLAIVSMSGRFPDAKDTEAYWDILSEGLDVHKTAPPLHWDANTHVDTSEKPKKNTSATPFGCWLKDPDEFDARFFNISPKEAPQIDPAQRLALMTAYEAIERAGIVPDATPSTRPDRVGVFYGVTSNDWMETNSAQDINAHMIPGGNRAFIPGRINYFFKFSGPSYAVDTACSSSLASIHVACNALWRGDIDTAIAGGTNVITNPDFTAGLDRGHFLSRTGNCKTFDDGADGYCRGEGVATLIIKRLDDAIADRDPVLGVILGASTNHSAESESITRPHVGAQRAIFTKILNESGVDPFTVSYIEMHGTGTQAGDAAEMASVLETFAPSPSSGKRLRSDDESLYLGSAKANIGHGEAASGASSLIKVLMMMEKDTIVPHCGIKTKINHKFPTDLDERGVHIASEPTSWERDTPRRVLVNNFSAAGGNSALLLEDAPRRPEISEPGPDSRQFFPIAVSAKSGFSLQGNLRSLLAYLQAHPGTSIGDISYTTTARRAHHPHRVLFLGKTNEDVCGKIETAIRDGTAMNRPKGSPDLVLAFTGQGAQYPGMAQQLQRESVVFATELRRLDWISRSLGFQSFMPFICSEKLDVLQFQPSVVQLASVCVQIALVRLWASWNIHPSAVIGHSLGEYAALNAAGVLSDADTIFLVGSRARLLDEKCKRDTHAMLVIDAPVDRIAGALHGRTYEIACINSPTETVLAGEAELMRDLETTLKALGMRSTMLKVPYAFHSSQVEPILPDLESLAANVRFSEPRIPVVRPLDCTVSTTGAMFDPAYLAQHSRQAVNMFGALNAAFDSKVITERSVVLEVGPHPAVSRMVKSTLGSSIASIASLQRGAQPWDVLARSLKSLYDRGAQIHWTAYQQSFRASHNVVQLPAYAWDLKPYWIQYVGDWSLRKGEAPAIGVQPPSIESTTIHTLVEESGDSVNTKIVVEADITRKDLSPLVQGHEVDGIPLCTPSVYADIALSIGKYLMERYHPGKPENLVDVSDMTISKALILREQVDKQLIRIYAEADWPSQSVGMRFVSFSEASGKTQEHSRCVVRFRDHSLQQNLQESASDTLQKIQSLRQGISTGDTARYNRAMVYRAIRPLARFHKDYRAIDEILLNSNTLEACSTLSFGNINRDGDFHTHPAVIDSLTQACGFAMNCNDNTDLDVEVFMNHGWGSLQLFEPIDLDKVYTTYTRMEPAPDKLWRGDSIIFDGERVVACFGQIAIQGVPRRVLKVILSLESGKKTASAASAHQQSPAVPQPPATKDEALPSDIVSQRIPTPTEPSTSEMALQIIAQESGVARECLTDEVNFADVGIDSLLGLTISARFREQLDVDLDFNALFYEHPTVKDLKAFLGDSAPNGCVVESPQEQATMTRGLENSLDKLQAPATKAHETVPKVDFSRVLQIISEESGVAAAALDDDANLADCGVDSLLSLIITSRFRNEFEIEIDNESLFLESPTIGDLKHLLLGKQESSSTMQRNEGQAGQSFQTHVESVKDLDLSSATKADLAQPHDSLLATRKRAVDELVERYAAEFSAPTCNANSDILKDSQKVVLVTGASGSLGAHLTYHLAQLDDVKTVVCLNRESREDAVTRQLKVMREKGIRFPDGLRSKLLILQVDSAKYRLGLEQSQYDKLTASVTHLIHQAWPMSATRPLVGFHTQFQVMRTLLDFARDAASSRPGSSQFSFQMVSSIGVVGVFPDGTHVPEERASIESVLPNGYCEAKWGCERMLENTLRRYPDRFRTMVARLGQIAGSKTSGYWNPMEHFGFLIKSSQTLNALPDVDGSLYWTPVDDVASTLSDLLLADNNPHDIYHVDNPVGQPWREMNGFLQRALKIPNLIPFHEWLGKVRQAPQRNNPAVLLSDFLDSNYLRMSCGGLVLNVSKSLEHSPTLRSVVPVSENIVRKYIHIWREIGFLQSTAEDKIGFEAERAVLWGPRESSQQECR